MMLFGALALISVPVAELWSTGAMAVLWLVGAPLAGLATGFWYQHRDTTVGVSANPLPYIATAVGILLGCTAAGIAGRGGPISYAGPLFVIGVGYVVFGRLDRSRSVATLGAAMTVAAAAVFALRPQHAYALTMLPFAAGSLLVGLANLLQSRRAT